VAGETLDNQAIPAITGSIPAIISRCGPNTGSSLGTKRETANSAIVIGKKAMPAWIGLNPRTSCRNWVRKKNIPNMPATSSSRATKDPDRPTSANSRSGVIGSCARVSIARNAASSTAAAPNEAIATESPPAVRRGPDERVHERADAGHRGDRARQVEPAGTRAVSATKRGAAISTAIPIGTLMNSTQRQSSHCVITPPRTRPSELPPITTPV